MAAGIVARNVLRNTGEVATVYFYAPDTASPDANLIPIRVMVDSTGALHGVNLNPLAAATKPRLLAIAATAITRPANVTAYTADDAVSNNATAGSVTPTSFTFADAADQPITLERMVLRTTDTGARGISFRMWFYQSDPSASTGIVGGDNAAFSTKQGTFIGSMSGVLRTFSDGAAGLLVPDEGSRIITNPTSTAQTVFGLLQTLTAFTPSASSTTFTPTLEGTQGRA